MSKLYFTPYTLLCALILIVTSVMADVCPYQECSCVEDIIDCVDLHLTSLPKLIVPTVSWTPLLDISDNLITNITAGGLPKGLGAIDFEGNPITFVDQMAFLGSENTITSLLFSGVNLAELPFALFYLNKLEHLSVKDSRIGQWDDTMLYYLGQTLKTLIIVNTGFTSFPEWLGGLPNLSILEFSEANVFVPDFAFRETQSLTSITIQNVTLTSTGQIFSGLVNLTDLFLDDNEISQLPGLPNSTTLTTLSLNDNDISDKTNLTQALLPIAGSLTTLYVSHNHLSTFPDLSFMAKLDVLYLSYNEISDTTIGSVPASVTSLELRNNKLVSLSSFVRNAVKLLSLSASYNSVSLLQGVDIPAAVTDMDVAHNLITALTDTSFPINSQIESLILDYNPISKISASAFANLKNLTYLSMANTKLTRLPVSLTDLQSLRSVDLSGNEHLVCTCMELNLRQWSATFSVAILGMCGRASIEYFLESLSVDCPD